MPKSREHMTCHNVLVHRFEYRFELLLVDLTLRYCFAVVSTRYKGKGLLLRLHTVSLDGHPTRSYSQSPLSYHCLTSTLVPLLASSSILVPRSCLLRVRVSMLERETSCTGINSLLFQLAVVQETHNQCSHDEQA